MLIYVDIDDTICRRKYSDGVGLDYSASYPIQERIDKINKLYDEGHTIHYWTARGTKTGIDWTEITTNQLKSWGVKYHELNLGKPAYDLFICDKARESKEYFDE